jgi:hypothetical protein
MTLVNARICDHGVRDHAGRRIPTSEPFLQKRSRVLKTMLLHWNLSARSLKLIFLCLYDSERPRFVAFVPVTSVFNRSFFSRAQDVGKWVLVRGSTAGKAWRRLHASRMWGLTTNDPWYTGAGCRIGSRDSSPRSVPCYNCSMYFNCLPVGRALALVVLSTALSVWLGLVAGRISRVAHSYQICW